MGGGSASDTARVSWREREREERGEGSGAGISEAEPPATVHRTQHGEESVHLCVRALWGGRPFGVGEQLCWEGGSQPDNNEAC